MNLTSMDLPMDEKLWVKYSNEDGISTHAITSNRLRTEYYLYENQNKTWVKTHKGQSPVDLYPHIPYEHES